MYWPLNAPREYSAYNAFGTKSETNEEGRVNTADSNDTSSGDDTIIGLEVARNGRLFATITTITLTVWQISVRYSGHLSTRSD